MPRSYDTASARDIEILNIALDMIHARNISTIDSTLTMNEEQKCANIYEDVRDLLLTRFQWRFAINQATILNSASVLGGAAIPYNYSYMSDIPSDCLRMLDVPNFAGDWRRYQDKILCDINTNTDDMHVKYIKQITDADQFHPNFAELLEIRLAKKLSIAIKDSKGDHDILEAEEVRVTQEAMRLDAFEDAENLQEDIDAIESDDAWVKVGR